MNNQIPIDLLRDFPFKALIRDPSSRKVLAEVLSEITKLDFIDIYEASFEGGEIVKRELHEKGMTSDILVKVNSSVVLILEMNYQSTVNLFSKNTTYAFGVLLELTKPKQERYPKVYLINFNGFSPFHTKKEIVYFKMRNENGEKEETDLLESIHINLVNIQKRGYNVSEKIKKFVDFLLTERLEELVKKYGKDEEYMAMVRTVEQLYTDPKYIGYYDVAEAERQEKEDIYLTGELEGRASGLQEGRISGIKEGKAMRDEEIARNLKTLNVPLSMIEKATGLSIREINKL